MTQRTKTTLLAFALLHLSTWAVGGQALAEPTYTIRWAQIHLPSSAADRAAFEFAEQVMAETNGDIEVIIHTRKEYEAVAGKRRNAVQITRDVIKGKLEMTQAYSHVLARYSQKLRILGMPYLFRDYAHAEKVFEGPLGHSFIDALERDSPLKAFGVAYSGGMGVISTQDLIARDPAVLDELRILISRGRYARMALYLGATYVVVGPDGLVPLAQADLVDAAETTVSCFDVYQDYLVNNVVNETHHFLLTSMVIINQEFYKALPEKYQEIVARVAKETVVRERAWSIAATVESRKKLEAQGITFVDLNQAEKDAYKTLFEPLYPSLLNENEQRIAQKVRAIGMPKRGQKSTQNRASNSSPKSDVQRTEKPATASSTSCAVAHTASSAWLGVFAFGIALTRRRTR
jgi:TRAP-type C4-dicarboxylate transport system substrate-binding protein